MNHKTISIFILNCDWRDRFGTSFVEFKDKLDRDRLGSEFNLFFVFSWARSSYFKQDGRFVSRHQKTRLDVFRPLLDLFAVPTVFYYVWKHKIKSDVWLCYDFGFVPTLWLLSRVFGGKLVMCLNNQPRIYSRTRKFGQVKAAYSWLVEKLFSGLVDHFFTINETMRTYIKGLGIKDERIAVFAMNTIDRDAEFIKQIKKGAVRARYNIPATQKIIITVARLEAEKNYPRLLELFATLGDDYTLIALGRGSLLAQLQEQCRQLKIADRVIFTGFVHRDEIWNYYADADVFVLISKAEALGVVFWEAMYMNVPVVGSDVEGIVETIGQNGERGRIWTENLGQDGFQKIIHEVIDRANPKTEAMLVAARQFVEQQIANNLIINDLV